MKKKLLPFILSLIWVALMVSLGIWFLFFTSGEEQYDEDENRMLAAAPAFTLQNIWNGNFSTDTENYLSDHSPARKKAIRFTNSLKSMVSAASYKDSLAVLDKTDEALSSDDLSQVDLDEMAGRIEEAREPSGTHRVKPPVNLEDYPEELYLTLNIDGYSSVYYIYDKVNVLAMTSVLNRIAALLPDDGELVYTMVPQSSVGNLYNEAGLKQGFVSDTEPMIDAVAASNVQAVSSAEILGAAMERGEYVYFRTDMHWSVPGTYLVYKEMVSRAGQEPAAWEDFEISVEEPFLGTLYRDWPTPYMEEHPDRLDLLTPKFGVEWRRIDGADSWYPIDLLDYNAASNDRYTVYLGGPGGPWTYAQCNNGIDRKCLVICDSFGLAFVPMVMQNYGQVHYYDPRYYDYETVGYTVKEMIEKYQISDVYVVIGDLHSYDNDFMLYQASSQLGD